MKSGSWIILITIYCLDYLATSRKAKKSKLSIDSADLSFEHATSGYLNGSKKDITLHKSPEKEAFSVATDTWEYGKVLYLINRIVPMKFEVFIKEAMEIWSEFTCVNFEVAEGIPHSFVEVQFTRSGCLLYNERGLQTVEAFAKKMMACLPVDIVLHELGHALGLEHVHQRSDRDKYIIVHEKNIPKRRKHLFIKNYTDYGNIPYDFESIMHYDFWVFGNGTKYTMTPLDPTAEATFRNAVKPSFYDYLQVNKKFQCEKPCKKSSLVCKNSGLKIANSKGECLCLCKPPYQGRTCNEQKNIENCNQNQTTEGEIASSKSYPKNWWCVIRIQAPSKDQNIQLYFTTIFDFDCETIVIIRSSGVLSDDAGTLYCGRQLNGKMLTSKTNEMLLIVKTGIRGNLGFQATATFI